MQSDKVARASPARIVTTSANPASARFASSPSDLCVAQFGGDHPTAAVVVHRGGQVDGGDAVRRAELHHCRRSARSCQSVEQPSPLAGDGHVDAFESIRSLEGRRRRGAVVVTLGETTGNQVIAFRSPKQSVEKGVHRWGGERVRHGCRKLDETVRLVNTAGPRPVLAPGRRQAAGEWHGGSPPAVIASRHRLTTQCVADSARSRRPTDLYSICALH